MTLFDLIQPSRYDLSDLEFPSVDVPAHRPLRYVMEKLIARMGDDTPGMACAVNNSNSRASGQTDGRYQMHNLPALRLIITNSSLGYKIPPSTHHYCLQSKGDNTFGSVRPSVHPSIRLCVCFCLSVIRAHARSTASHSGRSRFFF